MTEPQDGPPPIAPAGQHDATSGNPPDDRRADPPLPASAQVAERNAPETEAQREALETVRSISRLEESN